MTSTIQVEDIEIEVRRKLIKNLRLRVQSPAGDVRVTAPYHVSLSTVRSFAVSNLEWIRKQQKKLTERRPETALKYADGEKQCLWGEAHVLKVVEKKGKPCVGVCGRSLILTVPEGALQPKKQRLIETFYQAELRAAAAVLTAKWEQLMGVKVAKLCVRRMKTRWGSCSFRSRSIRLNTILVHMPPVYLEYVLIHELVHLLEPSHGRRFKEYMDQFLPEWRARRKELRGAPCA